MCFKLGGFCISNLATNSTKVQRLPLCAHQQKRTTYQWSFSICKQNLVILSGLFLSFSHQLNYPKDKGVANGIHQSHNPSCQRSVVN